MDRYYRAILLALILAMVPNTVWAQKITKESLLSAEKKRTFYLYVPETVKAATPPPLVILLHGSNRNGLSLAEKWKDLATKEAFLIVAPDSIDSAVWGIPADGPDFMRDLVDLMKTRYSIDSRRVYLFGHSGGAGFALLMALYESQYFAAIAVHAGALNTAGLEVIPIAKRKTPIQIQVGNMDPLFPLLVVRETRDALKAASFPVELKEIPNHDHWYYNLAPKINDAAWSFLKAHSLTDEPVFEVHNFGKASKAAKKTEASIRHYNRGIELLRKGDFAGAIVELSKAIEGEETNADAYNNRAVAHANQKNFEAAIKDFTRSIQLKPTAAAYGNRGGIYFALKKTDEAVADFAEAIKLDPSAENYANRGLALAQSGKESEGLADYERAIQLNPKFGRAYILRGLLALNQSRADAAQKDFDIGFKLDPKLHAEFDALIQQIRVIRGLK